MTRIREKIIRAIDGADCHSLGFSNRAADAILNILSEPGEEVVKQLGIDIARRAYSEAPAHSWVSHDSRDAHYQWVVRAAIAAFLSDRNYILDSRTEGV
jgi:hypothetical protein